jgi:hypothetical protein
LFFGWTDLIVLSKPMLSSGVEGATLAMEIQQRRHCAEAEDRQESRDDEPVKLARLKHKFTPKPSEE